MVTLRLFSRETITCHLAQNNNNNNNKQVLCEINQVLLDFFRQFCLQGSCVRIVAHCCIYVHCIYVPCCWCSLVCHAILTHTSHIFHPFTISTKIKHLWNSNNFLVKINITEKNIFKQVIDWGVLFNIHVKKDGSNKKYTLKGMVVCKINVTHHFIINKNSESVHQNVSFLCEWSNEVVLTNKLF